MSHDGKCHLRILSDGLKIDNGMFLLGISDHYGNNLISRTLIIIN